MSRCNCVLIRCEEAKEVDVLDIDGAFSAHCGCIFVPCTDVYRPPSHAGKMLMHRWPSHETAIGDVMEGSSSSDIAPYTDNRLFDTSAGDIEDLSPVEKKPPALPIEDQPPPCSECGGVMKVQSACTNYHHPHYQEYTVFPGSSGLFFDSPMVPEGRTAQKIIGSTPRAEIANPTAARGDQADAATGISVQGQRPSTMAQPLLTHAMESRPVFDRHRRGEPENSSSTTRDYPDSRDQPSPHIPLGAEYLEPMIAAARMLAARMRAQEAREADHPDQTMTDTDDDSDTTERPPRSSPDSDSSPRPQSSRSNTQPQDQALPPVHWSCGGPNGRPQVPPRPGMRNRSWSTSAADKNSSRSACACYNRSYPPRRCSTCTSSDWAASSSLDSCKECGSCPSCRYRGRCGFRPPTYRCRCGDDGLTSTDPSLGPTSATSSTGGTIGSFSPASSSTDLQWARYHASPAYRGRRYGPFPMYGGFDPNSRYPRFLSDPHPFHRPVYTGSRYLPQPLALRPAQSRRAHSPGRRLATRRVIGPSSDIVGQVAPALWLTLVGLVATAVATPERPVEMSRALGVLISLVGYLAVCGTLWEGEED